MSSLEEALAAHLNGKFFWEPTATPQDTIDNKDALEIRKAQKAFAKDAKSITTRNKNLPNLNSPQPLKTRLSEEQKVMLPIILAVSEAYDVSPDDLIGSRKMWNLSQPRKHLYWALFRYIPGMTLVWAGKLMNKAHTTILFGKEGFQKEHDIEKVVIVDEIMGWK